MRLRERAAKAYRTTNAVFRKILDWRLKLGGRADRVSIPPSVAFRAITRSPRRPAARADMPHTPGRKKLAAKDEASFVKRELGSAAPPRLRCIAPGAVACYETVLNLGATSGGAVKLIHHWIAKWSRSISIDGHPILRKKRWAFAGRLTIASEQVCASATTEASICPRSSREPSSPEVHCVVLPVLSSRNSKPARLSRRQLIHGRSAMPTMMVRSRRSWISMFSRLARTNLTTNTRLR